MGQTISHSNMDGLLGQNHAPPEFGSRPMALGTPWNQVLKEVRLCRTTR